MELKKIADEMKAKLKDEKELQKIMEIAKKLCPDNELSLDDLDSVSGGTVVCYENGEICNSDKVLLSILLGGYVGQHGNEALTLETAKEGAKRFIASYDIEISPKVEQFIEEVMRAYVSQAGNI